MKAKLFILVLAVISTVFPSCNNGKKPFVVYGKDLVQTNRAPGQLEEYFPMAIGATWTYNVQLGNINPIESKLITWPQGKMATDVYIRGYLVYSETNRSGLLELKVSRRATKQGLLQISNGVEVSVVKDEVGIFNEVSKLFFVATEIDSYSAKWLTLHSPESTPGAPYGSWGGWGADSGYCLKNMLFGSKPNTVIYFVDSPNDRLTFLDWEGEVLHYQRTVATYKRTHDFEKITDKKKETPFDEAFVEDYYFKRNVGLIKLVQTVGGKMSMIWTLEKYYSRSI